MGLVRFLRSGGGGWPRCAGRPQTDQRVIDAVHAQEDRVYLVGEALEFAEGHTPGSGYQRLKRGPAGLPYLGAHLKERALHLRHRRRALFRFRARGHLVAPGGKHPLAELLPVRHHLGH